MSPEARRRFRPWKLVANVAKVFCALQIPVGFWVSQIVGHPVDPWAIAQVSLWTYAFFAPVDVGLITAQIHAIVKPAEAP